MRLKHHFWWVHMHSPVYGVQSLDTQFPVSAARNRSTAMDASIRHFNNDYEDISYGIPMFASPPLNPGGFSEKRKPVGGRVTEQELQGTPQSEYQGFLPDQEDYNHNGIKRRIKTFPLLGFAALVGSALTVMCSLAILLIVNNHVVWPNEGWAKVMRPASWLSALLSANSVFLHVALTEGVTTAWWYRATRQDATIRELHDVWSHGTSFPAALTAGRRLSYVSIATIFLGILPLNGFLLQGAISTVLSSETTDVMLTIPSVKSLPLGYSGILYEDDRIDLLGTAFDGVWLQVMNMEGTHNAQYAYFGSNLNGSDGLPIDFGCENSSICTGSVQGVGFNTTCEDWIIPYNLLPINETGTSGQVFYSGFDWFRSSPNTIYLTVVYKEDSSCIGDLTMKNCTLQAAVVDYPVQVQMNDSSSIYPGPYFSLVDGTTIKDDKLQSILPVNPEDAIGNTIFGGIAYHLGTYFNSEMNISTWLDADGQQQGTYNCNGHLPISLAPGFLQNDAEHQDDFEGYCNVTFKYPLEDIRTKVILDSGELDSSIQQGYNDWRQDVDLTQFILEPVRKAMFLASVLQGSVYFSNVSSVSSAVVGNSDYHNESTRAVNVQEVPGIQVRPVGRYEVRFYLWGASLGITYTVIGFIFPLFWGFWLLRRKPTMSPVDLARAFKAPVLSEHDHHETQTLLKKHGHMSIHHDLVPNSPDSNRHASISSMGVGYFEQQRSPTSRI